MANAVFIQEVVNLTNQFRAQHGLGALSVNWNLSEAAQTHSENMAYQDFFSHIGADGSRPWDRAREAGYGSISVGENIGAGYSTPQGVVDAWIRSDGHRANMLNSKFNEIGVGYFYLQDDPGELTYQSYWAQVFGKGTNEVQVQSAQSVQATQPIEPTQPTQPMTLQVMADESFVALQYGASYGDLVEAFGNNADALWQHYQMWGQQEGRSLDAFNEVNYLAAYDDLLNAFGRDTYTAVQHYLTNGYYENRSPDAFASSQYLASHKDLIAAFGLNLGAAAEHFVNYGYSEGRTRDEFDEGRYLASNHDLIQSFGYDLEAATQHYISAGMTENRSLDAFDPAAYLSRYGDLQAAFGNDLDAATRHFIQYGYGEGRVGTA
jgi:hypothetical protein